MGVAFKQVTIKTAEGTELFCQVRRDVRELRSNGGFMRLGSPTGVVVKQITVSYGLGGIHGEGASLKEAVADLNRRGSFFVAHRHEIDMGRVEMI